MKLSGRLLAIAEMVPQVDTVADIGCDHGKLAVWLVQNGRARRAVCGDISAPSLEKARKKAAEEGLADRISARVGSGLSVLAPGEADAAVIAGMGGELITSILEDDPDKTPDVLVLSCHSMADVLRGWLADNGFRFEDEVLIEEGRHFYPVMRVRRGQGTALTEVEREFGPVLLRKKPEALRKLLDRRIREAQRIYAELERADSPRKTELLRETDDTLKRYEEVRTWL